MKTLYVCDVCGEIYENEYEANIVKRHMSNRREYVGVFFINIKYIPIKLR